MHFASAGFVENGMLSKIAPLSTVTALNETTERRSEAFDSFFGKSGWNIADVTLYLNFMKLNDVSMHIYIYIYIIN